MLKIFRVESEDEHLDAARKLFKEYAYELNEDLGFQSFNNELQDPLKKYGLPGGSLFVALWNGQHVGCVALQQLSEQGVCEMKRLYVQPDYRKYGIGDVLVKQLLTDAKNKGYTKMVLDTLERLEPAIKLYDRNGFFITSAYYANPLPNVVYMEKQL